MLGGNTLLTPFLNSRQAMLEGVHVAGRAALAFHSSHARSVWQQYDGRDSSDGIFFIYSGRLIPVRFVPRWQHSFCHSGLVVAK
jgi:hypothetical protein